MPARSRPSTPIWAIGSALALLWPTPGGMFDGIPLDEPFEAVLIGMLVPLLFVLEWKVFNRGWARLLVVLLVAVKLAAVALLTTNGFCTEFRTDAPVAGPIGTIEIAEPSGLMHSWDVRAHWGGGASQCSAITRRDYPTRASFPAWFVNVLENTVPAQHELSLVMRGVVTVSAAGTLSFDVVPAAAESLTVDGQAAATMPGRLDVPVSAGSHAVELRTRLSGDQWRVVQSWNGGTLWSSALVTMTPPTWADRALWRVLPVAIGTLVLALIGAWAVTAIRTASLDRSSAVWIGALALVAASCAWIPALQRFGSIALVPAAFSPAARRDPDWRTALWLIGVPWLVFAGVLAMPRLGEFTLYSRGDDWLSYQISAYRIYLQGYWLETGEKLFYYQPLYRWIAGALHVVFGDSSAGEVFWDGGCLLVGAMLTFVVCRPHLGGQRALGAAVLTLATFTVTPIWYFIGRGLAEISAAAFAWTAALLLMRGRVSGASAAIGAGLFGVLAFYARLNHMLFVGALLAFLLPLTLPAAALRNPLEVLQSIPVRRAAIFVGMLAVGVGLLSVRAWYYTGEISPFAGTSLGLNYTGLAPRTIFSGAVWQRVLHSVFAETIVNERFDVRGLLVCAGCVAALLAMLQLPRFSKLPLVVSAAVLGALAGALIAHAHGYPGRFSVHLVPLATAIAVMAMLRMGRDAPAMP